MDIFHTLIRRRFEDKGWKYSHYKSKLNTKQPYRHPNYYTKPLKILHGEPLWFPDAFDMKDILLLFDWGDVGKGR